MLSSSQIRQQFIDFFVQKCGHTYVPSAPVVPHDDPTLLFTNAGMNQFKDVFLNVGTRPYSRAVNTQKCIRAGGKHNDLDDVGKDTYHHTFFEMLGNWSFGDYFKAEAIEWAWELLTGVWGIEKDRLHATVFEGNPDQGIERDDEARDLWQQVTDIEPSHIHYGDMKDNFWEMGETGPCGPCSEIHIDLTSDKSGASLVNAGDARAIEIWNLVFIQFNRDSSGALTPLPAKHVDTGMGFERLCALLQDKSSNYDTDVFTPIFTAIAEVTGAGPYSGDLQKPEDVAYRVIADHIRTLTVALTDGALPSNEGRGYVLRRILRRAVRYGRQTLGTKEPFFHRLVPKVVEMLGPTFVELLNDPNSVAEVIRDEEELFSKTLDRGIAHFADAAARSQVSMSGADAFELYATYGFPLDLTQLMAEEQGLAVDTEGFDAEMARHQEISRGRLAGTDGRASLAEVIQKASVTATSFLAYTQFSAVDCQPVLVAVLDANGQFTKSDAVRSGESAAIVVDRTPFYAEAGGQVGDVGTIRGTDGNLFRVEDTVKVGGVIVHLGRMESGTLDLSDGPRPWALEVEESRRRDIMAHHTATHLMNRALRAVLGDHVQQKGSLVDDQKTRFDFSHSKALGAEDVSRIEQIVAEDIGRDLEVHAAEAPQEDALKIHGLRAVFGEKYPPRVRVVSIGVAVDDLLADPDNHQWYEYSIEFCGGTHLERTGQAERLLVVGEEAVAKGVRRMTAVAGRAAQEAVSRGEAVLVELEKLAALDADELAGALAAFSDALGEKVVPLAVREQARARVTELQRLIKEHQRDASQSRADQVIEAARNIADANEGAVIVAPIADADQNALRAAMDVIRSRRPDAALLLGSANDGKVAFVARVPPAMIDGGLKAGDWVRVTAKVAGGGGGGRSDMAQAGGKDPSKLDAALELARKFAEEKLADG